MSLQAYDAPLFAQASWVLSTLSTNDVATAQEAVAWLNIRADLHFSPVSLSELLPWGVGRVAGSTHMPTRFTPSCSTMDDTPIEALDVAGTCISQPVRTLASDRSCGFLQACTALATVRLIITAEPSQCQDGIRQWDLAICFKEISLGSWDTTFRNLRYSGVSRYIT